MTIEVIYDKDCPNVEGARAHLRQALSGTGLPAEWQEWDRANLESPQHAKFFGSPTILINGKDVAQAEATGEANCCRVYVDEAGQFKGTPSIATIVAALRTALPRKGWQSVVPAVPAIGAVLLPSLSCPACWPAYAGLLSSLGVGFFNFTPYLFPVTAAFLLIALGSMAYKARTRKGYKPVLLATFAAICLVMSRFVFDVDLATYGSIALLIGASVWNAWPDKKTVASACPACKDEDSEPKKVR